jgi:dephospho-CoA kinase
MPIEEKKALADHVIDNTGSLEETEAQVNEVYAQLVEGPE